jgi:DNA-binding transcriptional LysR family regulator
MDKTIEYVLEVSRTGGIARAARNLYITPSALSKFIIQKERELGVRIFNREGNQFTLTYAGEQYVRMLTSLKAQEEQMRLEMKRLAELYMGRLRVGFQMFYAETMITHIIPTLQQTFPNLRVLLKEDTAANLESSLLQNQLDLILTITDEERKDLRYLRMQESPVVLAAPRDSGLAGMSSVHEGFAHPWLMDEVVAGQQFVLDPEARSIRKYAGYLIKTHPEMLEGDTTVSNARTALLAVQNGLGCIILPELLVKELGMESKVELYSFGAAPDSVWLSIVYNPQTVLIDEITEFEAAIRAYYKPIS